MEVEPLVRLVAAPLRRMDIDANIADVTQDVTILALRDCGANVAAEAPVKEPQVVLRIAVDLDAAKLIDAPTLLQEIARECNALRHPRQREVLARERVEC